MPPTQRRGTESTLSWQWEDTGERTLCSRQQAAIVAAAALRQALARHHLQVKAQHAE